jgi:hypothetical protein
MFYYKWPRKHKKVKPLTPFLMALIIILESNQPRKKVTKATIETKEGGGGRGIFLGEKLAVYNI